MLADAMPPEQEIEEDDQTPTDDDLRRRRPIPVNVPPLGSADDLQTQPVLRASPSASRAIPVGAEEADASEPQETAPIIRPAGSRAIPTSTTSGVALRRAQREQYLFQFGPLEFSRRGGCSGVPYRNSHRGFESRCSAPVPMQAELSRFYQVVRQLAARSSQRKSLQTFEHSEVSCQFKPEWLRCGRKPKTFTTPFSESWEKLAQAGQEH